MENNSQPHIQERVLEKIRKGEVGMRPRLYFVAQVAAVAALALVTLALSIYVLSFILFSIHESGEQFLLGFGGRGLLTLAELFPWLTLLLVVALFVALEWLLRYFKFGYSFSMLRIFLSIAAVAVVGSAAVTLTPLHAFLLDRADRGALPVFGGIYESVYDSHQAQGVFRGVVSLISTSTFVCTHDDTDRDTDDGTWTILPPQDFNLGSLSVGDRVYVAGELQNGTVQAYGIQQFPASQQ